MSDEEFDSVFRSVANKYPKAAPPPGAWERLDEQLAATVAPQQLRRRVGGALGAEVALVALMLWLSFQLAPQFASPSPRAGELPAASRRPARAGTSQPGVAPTLADPKAATAATLLTLGPTVPTQTAPAPAGLSGSHQAALVPASVPKLVPSPARWALGLPRLLTEGFGSVDATSLSLAEPRRTKHNLLTIREATNKNFLTFNRKEYSAPSENPAERAGATAAENATPGDVALLAGTPPAPLAVVNAQLPDSLRLLAVQPLLDSTRAPQRAAARPTYRLVVGVLGAPSFSAVRTPQSAQLGGDYGLTLEYRFTARLRVRAGLISSQKRYRAARTNYEAPAAWQWYPGDYLLDANCRITEIPLDLRFDVLNRPGYTLFTSLGVNSLLMRNERYSYDWTMNGQTFTKAAQVLNGSNHFLSVLNLAVGIERPIGGRWALQAEPFWQIPLGAVGAGQVRLSSAGAAFSLKFNLLR